MILTEMYPILSCANNKQVIMQCCSYNWLAPAARPILAKFPNITRTINPYNCILTFAWLLILTGASSEYNFTQRCLANLTGIWREVFCGVYMRGEMPSRGPIRRRHSHDIYFTTFKNVVTFLNVFTWKQDTFFQGKRSIPGFINR
jgi:hypothetical protein